MDKFCRECGSRINEGAKFCPNCGAKIANPVADKQQNNPPSDSFGLPEGMTRTPDGKIWWSFFEKKKEVMCYFDDTKLAVMHEAEPEKKRSALGGLLLDVGELIAMENDPMLPLPSDFEGNEPTPRLRVNGKEYYHYPYEFRYISKMKEDRKHNIIKLYCNTWWTLCLTDKQYDFVLNHILTHCPNIKRK